MLRSEEPVCPREAGRDGGPRSQATSDAERRTLDLFLRLPLPVFRRVFGREWYVERGRAPGRRVDDIFDALHDAPS